MEKEHAPADSVLATRHAAGENLKKRNILLSRLWARRLRNHLWLTGELSRIKQPRAPRRITASGVEQTSALVAFTGAV
ncbi:MAG TPA: hypothetical protein VNL14_06370 [Candidatus Acidoferrales bacterium]|nr:hypothetical protein [Candidatus Acidoferrales bacterium]